MNEHEITFGKLTPEGGLTDVRKIKQADIGKCPHFIMVPEHYREDGTCKCDSFEEQAMMVRDWGYAPSDFERATRD